MDCNTSHAASQRRIALLPLGSTSLLPLGATSLLPLGATSLLPLRAALYARYLCECVTERDTANKSRCKRAQIYPC
jgi:hypothetical protein